MSFSHCLLLFAFSLATAFNPEAALAGHKCESFINHELKLAGTGSEFSKTGKCYSKVSDERGKKTVIYQRVAPRSGCMKQPNGYTMPGWWNYSAFGIRVDDSGENTRVETLFSYGQDESMDERPYDLAREPKVILALTFDCKIERVILPADEGEQHPLLEWTPASCKKLKPASANSKLSRGDQAIQEGCKHLLENYAAYLPADNSNQKNSRKIVPAGTKP